MIDTVCSTEMQKLAFLIGEWAGSGWVEFGDQKFDFEQTEKAYFKLEGAVLVLEGQGRAGGQVVHNAYGIYSFDPQKKIFQFNTFEANGRKTCSTATIDGNVLIWAFRDSEKGVSIRFTARFENDYRTWIESGEKSIDETSWTKFFEMKLRKLNL